MKCSTCSWVFFDVFAGIFTGDWDRVWEGVKEIFSGVWDFVVNTFTNWIDTFKGLADTVLGWFGTSWNEAWSSVKDFFEGVSEDSDIIVEGICFLYTATILFFSDRCVKAVSYTHLTLPTN